jgi:chemotaxis response regulator CheB
MYKGAPTNNLVMLLTNPNKQIASGAMDRKDAYRLVKEMNLQDVIAEGEGPNYASVKTDKLEEYTNGAPVGTVEEAAEETEKAPEVPNVKAAPHADTVEWFYMGLKAMLKNHLLYTDDIAVIADLTTELYKKLKEEEPKITDSDIDDIIASI